MRTSQRGVHVGKISYTIRFDRTIHERKFFRSWRFFAAGNGGSISFYLDGSHIHRARKSLSNYVYLELPVRTLASVLFSCIGSRASIFFVLTPNRFHDCAWFIIWTSANVISTNVFAFEDQFHSDVSMFCCRTQDASEYFWKPWRVLRQASVGSDRRCVDPHSLYAFHG